MHALRRRALLGVAAAFPAALSIASPPSAAAPAASAPSPAEPPEPTAPYCATRALTPEAMAAGEITTIRCFDSYAASLEAIGVPVAEPAGPATNATGPALNGDGVLADHFEFPGGTGQVLTIGGTTCDGGGLSLAAGDWWNDRIRATRPRSCSKVKHWTDANFQGTTETVGTALKPVPLTAPVAGAVSSIRYYP